MACPLRVVTDSSRTDRSKVSPVDFTAKKPQPLICKCRGFFADEERGEFLLQTITSKVPDRPSRSDVFDTDLSDGVSHRSVFAGRYHHRFSAVSAAPSCRGSRGRRRVACGGKPAKEPGKKPYLPLLNQRKAHDKIQPGQRLSAGLHGFSKGLFCIGQQLGHPRLPHPQGITASLAKHRFHFLTVCVEHILRHKR